MTRLDRAGATVANALRVLPTVVEPGYPSPTDFAAGQRLERMVERVHALGPRVVSELLAEIAIATGEPGLIADHVEKYSRLDPEIVRALGADRFPPMPLEVVR